MTSEEDRGWYMAPATYEDPEVHLKRTWLTAQYQPGPCWLCDKVCDLRLPGTCLMWALGVPNPFHLECGDRPDLWHNSQEVKMNIAVAERVFAFRETVNRLLRVHENFLAALDGGVVAAGRTAQALLLETEVTDEGQEEMVNALVERGSLRWQATPRARSEPSRAASRWPS